MAEQPSFFLRDHSKSKSKIKENLGKSREFQTICLNQSELKHMHAIRPYCSKDRKSSRRDSVHNQSPHELSRSKSKRFDSSVKKAEDSSRLGGKQLNEMYRELINLKSEYKILKANYNRLMQDKKQTMERQEKEKMRLTEQLQEQKRQLQRQKRNNGLLQNEIERIKKQCLKIIEMQRFKFKKMEQTLQEKELMIAFLRNSLQNSKKEQGGEQQPSLFFMQNSLPMLNFDYFSKQTNSSLMGKDYECQKPSKNGHIIEQDSLSFSRDKSKETDSIIHSFLSHDQSLFNHNFIKKENIFINSLNQSPIPSQIEIIDEISQKSEKSLCNPQKSDLCSQKSSLAVPVKESKVSEDKSPQIVESEERSLGVKSKVNAKRLQISITDQNMDSNNIPEELIIETKKKSVGAGYKQKKKLTAKKSRQL